MQVEPPRFVHPPSIGAMLLVAAAYCVTGRLGLLLAISPGYATAVWPPSGIALAAVLLCGYRVVPGIVLGSFLVNLWTSFDATTIAAMLQSVVLASSISLGAALQAIVGAGLIRRCVGFPCPLDQEKDVGLFLLLGGPISCLVNATIGVSSLWIGGVIPGALTLFSWWTWWVGDSLGVLIVTPLVLIWTAEPRQVWRRRRIALAVPLGVAFTVTTVFFVYTSGWERDRIQLAFERQASSLGHTLANSFDGYLEVLHALESFYASSREVDEHEFRTFVQGDLARHVGIQALEWIPRVPDAERARYAEAMRRAGYPDFQITEREAQGQMVRAARRDAYFPVTYVEPYEMNKLALGFDLASNPARLEALRQARDTGEPVATARITLVQETGRQFGFLIFLPIYHNGLPHTTVEERRQNLQGFALGVFRIGDMVESSLHRFDQQGIALALSDQTAPEDQRVLYGRHGWAPQAAGTATDAGDKANPVGIHWETTHTFAGRHWLLRFTPTLAYLTARQTWQPWAVMAGGLLFTGMLGAFLLVVTGRTASIERLVTERTAALSRANTALEHEITERKQTESALAEAQEQEVTIASRIQQTLLLGRPLDSIPGLQMATLTIPSQHIDGDFYDCIKHTDHCVDILIGDVMGKGVPAALVAAALKSQFLRAFGQLALASAQSMLPSPAALVNAMHAEVTEQLIAVESFATLCLARFEVAQRRMTFVDCGHTRTMHFRRHTGTCQPLQGINVPLGFSPQEVYTESVIDFDAGDLFVFYSDGITETPNAAGELFGEDRLAEIIDTHSHMSPDVLIDTIHQAVMAFSPTGRSTDDVTCLVLSMARHTMAEPLCHRAIEVPSELAALAHVRAFIRSVCQDTLHPALDEAHTSHLELAIHEAASNIMQHAYHGHPDQRITVAACVFEEQITMRLTHWGDSFVPARVATPAFDGSQDRGFGLFLIEQFMDDVRYTSEPSGANVIQLVKHLAPLHKGLRHGHPH